MIYSVIPISTFYTLSSFISVPSEYYYFSHFINKTTDNYQEKWVGKNLNASPSYPVNSNLYDEDRYQ